MELVGAVEQMPEATLRELYPDNVTCRALMRAVNRQERAGNIDAERAVAILRLGEPAVYGALAQLPELPKEGA